MPHTHLMTLLLAAAGAWVLLALPAGVLMGRGIRLADQIAEEQFRVDSVERYLREQAAAPLS